MPSKSRKTYLFVILVILLTLFGPKIALANMLGEDPPLWSVVAFIAMTSIIGIAYYTLFVSINIVVEYSIFYLFMRKHISNKVRPLLVYALANLVSYPPTILIFTLSSTYYLFALKALDPHDAIITTKDLVIPIIMAELTAITIETIILSIGLSRLYKKGFISVCPRPKKILVITVIANIVSFAFSPILWTFK